jgi:hypothetical protein
VSLFARIKLGAGKYRVPLVVGIRDLKRARWVFVEVSVVGPPWVDDGDPLASYCSQQKVRLFKSKSVAVEVSRNGVCCGMEKFPELVTVGILLLVAKTCWPLVRSFRTTKISRRLSAWKNGSEFGWTFSTPQIPAYAIIVVPDPGS